MTISLAARMYGVLMYALVEVSAELAEQLVAIETGGEDAVHQARTRVRRLRSILAVFRKAFDEEEQRRMRARLKRLGHRLGDVRDLDVRARDLEGLLSEQTDPAVADAVEAMAARARAQYGRALDDLLRHVRSRGHRELLADLQSFAAAPPLSEDGSAHPHRVARKGLRRAARRVLRVEGERLEERHAARKAARRLRYAAEAVADDLGGDAVRLAEAAEELQDALGEHRDLVLLARHLREHAELDGLPAVRAGVEALAEDCERRAAEKLAGLDEKLGAVEAAAEF
ncbi:CHAD domain-containing protein [Leifsonia shinshuensis]|uniref:CHAD domain-containing protein n=1 Tax=Leifsonia shinshuensis TaxID=150026 RepID=UPI00285D508D|nr:CHAD domain-containing protein [Leifsonia shinshuensis]MDR6970231.1 CHAD domain-containing protein [Leifsonia shinshuensis]